MYLEDLLAVLRLEVTLRGERVTLLVIQILFQIEERVEKDGSHLAALQIVERYLAGHCRVDHVQHLIANPIASPIPTTNEQIRLRR